jgi:PknH-like extracellular domain
VALLLGACAPTPAHDATVGSRLDDMLADESAVNAIMGPPPLTATHTYRALEQWPARYSYSPADCLAVSGNAMASVYQGARSGEMRGTLFTNDQNFDQQCGVLAARRGDRSGVNDPVPACVRGELLGTGTGGASHDAAN